MQTMDVQLLLCVAGPPGIEIALPSFDCKENYTIRESPFCIKSLKEVIFNSVNET